MLNRSLVLSAFSFTYLLAPKLAQGQDVALSRQVDSIANQVLQSTGVPSATVAVVKNGRTLYANAYGSAKLDPRAAATPDLRYAKIGRASCRERV